MDMQNVSNLQIPEGTVRTIHDKDNRLIWGRVAYNTKYSGDTVQNGTPTPDTPILVQVATGGQTVTISDGVSSQSYEVNLGKNLLPITMANQTLNGVSFTVDEDKSIKMTGTATARTEPRIYQSGSGVPSITLKAGVTYHNSMQEVLYFYSGAYRSIQPNGSYTPSANETISFAYIRVENGITVDKTVYPMLEKGSTSTPYAPYFTPIELCKIGDYQDYIYKSGDDWYLHKAVEKNIYDGEGEAWLKAGDGSMRTALSPDAVRGSSSNNPIMSNQYVSRFSTSVNNSIFLSGGQSQLGIADNVNAVDYQTWKSWLNSNNLIVYYALGTPTDTKITDTALIAQLNSVHQWLTRYGYESTVSGNLPIVIAKTNL